MRAARARRDARPRATASTAGFELLENVPREPRQRGVPRLGEVSRCARWDLDRADSLRRSDRARERRSGATNPALQRDWTPALPCRSTTTSCICLREDRRRTATNVLIVVVNLDPAPHAGGLGRRCDLARLGARRRAQPFQVHDLLTDARYPWHGARNLRRARPAARAGARLRVVQLRVRTEPTSSDFTVIAPCGDPTATDDDRRSRPQTIRSGTRTRSSTSCTSRRSSTATATASATSRA